MDLTNGKDYHKYEPIFGAWYITDEIGSGAEGKAFRIRRTDSLGHEYYSALKIITIPENEAAVESLMAGGVSREGAEKYYENLINDTAQEFELLAKLKGNSYIVSYEDHEIFHHEDGFGWDILIRMEELTPLVKYSINNPLTPEDVAQLGHDISRGLSLCRQYGIIHRDIKPDNIFVSPSGHYKLGDFGVAKIISKSKSALSRKGTYEYMAPEVYWGKESDYSIDIYSLGLVMYRYLNDGRAPFMPEYDDSISSDSRKKAFLKRINGYEIPAPRKGSPELNAIVLKACAYDKKDRYQSANDMLRDLVKVTILRAEQTESEGQDLDSINISASDPKLSATSAPETDSKENKGTNKRGKIIAAVITICLLAAGIIYWMIPKEVTAIEGIDPEIEIYIGDEITPDYDIQPDRFEDEEIEFRSGDESVVKVDPKGSIHAVGVGEATLSMTVREYTQESVISVVPKVTDISGVDEIIEITTGDTVTLTPVLSPEKFAAEPITYTSADENIATVSAAGEVTAVSAGETNMTISAGGCSRNFKISVSDPIIYYSQPSSSSSSGSSSSGYSSSSDEGYFDSSDDEYF